MLMVSRFMNCLGLSHFPRHAFLFWSFLELFTVFFFLCCQDLVDIFCHILLYLLIKFCGSCCTYLLFHQRCSSTSITNTFKSFCVPRSWTNNISCRDKRHRKHGTLHIMHGRNCYLTLQIFHSQQHVVSFSLVGCLYHSSSSYAVFSDGRFLLDAGRRNLSLPVCCKGLQHQH